VASPNALLDAFARDGWKSEPFERMLDSARADPTNAFRLLDLAIQRGSKSATFLDAAVSFVPENLLPDLANHAATAFLKDTDNEVAESIIAYLSLQAVDCLQPFLLKFFDATPNASAYYAHWPWRSASDTDTKRLLASLEAAASPEERLRPFRCILESRNPKYLSQALEALESGELPYDTSVYLAEVGLDGPERALYSKTVFHIRIPLDVLSYLPKPVWLQPTNHPTWSLPANSGRHRFGGNAESVCGLCDAPLHNLITFDPTPDGIGFARPARLEIATCLSCLGWSKAPLFFEHDAAGIPKAMDSGHKDPDFPACPLRETWVELSPTPPRWKWQDWALSNSRESLHRVGGHPTWIQSAEYPTCPRCHQLMPLLLQLDSDLPTQDGSEWLWGSGGICYVFWCGSCRVSASLWQCT
jgi:hypothetical protein